MFSPLFHLSSIEVSLSPKRSFVTLKGEGREITSQSKSSQKALLSALSYLPSPTCQYHSNSQPPQPQAAMKSLASRTATAMVAAVIIIATTADRAHGKRSREGNQRIVICCTNHHYLMFHLTLYHSSFSSCQPRVPFHRHPTSPRLPISSSLSSSPTVCAPIEVARSTRTVDLTAKRRLINVSTLVLLTKPCF